PTARGTDVHSVGAAYRGVLITQSIPEVLELTDDYPDFLKTLGNHTRRDMRRLERKAGSSGFIFEWRKIDFTGADERRRLGLANQPRPYRATYIDAADAFLAAQTTGFHADMRSATGELLSCCAGFVVDSTAIVIYQINHAGYPKAS